MRGPVVIIGSEAANTSVYFQESAFCALNDSRINPLVETLVECDKPNAYVYGDFMDGTIKG